MNNFSRLCLALVALALLAFPAFAADSDLDGKTFTVTVLDGDSSWSDDLVFQNGSLHSTACDEYGFGAESYAASADGASVTFESHGTSATHGTSHWQGSIAGNSISGTLTWTQPGQAPAQYAFEGSLKN